MICKYYKIVFGLFALVFSFFAFSSSVNAITPSDLSDFTFTANGDNIRSDILSEPVTSASGTFCGYKYALVNLSSNNPNVPKIHFSVPAGQNDLYLTPSNPSLGSTKYPFQSLIDFSYLTFDSFNSCYITGSWGYFTVLLTNSNPYESSSAPSGSIDITENGQYDVSQYATANVNVPPEIIQGDYHDDLVSIKIGIYTCAAVLLVLYFFYCIYRIIIKGGSL